MTTILIKKKDTTGAPTSGDLTNAAGGAEIAVNTSDLKIYTKNAGGSIVQIGSGPSATDTLTNKTIAFGSNTLTDVAGTSATQTLTNKRIDPRVSTATSTASLTPDVSSFDQYNLTAQAATLAINAPIGTPVDGNKLIFRILDNGVSQTLNWNGTYTVVGTTLPTTTTVNKTTYVGCIYNANNTRWDVIAVTTQA